LKEVSFRSTSFELDFDAVTPTRAGAASKLKQQWGLVLVEHFDKFDIKSNQLSQLVGHWL